MSQHPQPPSVPVVLELAPLPREQAGPFLILGVPKSAPKDHVEEQWAKRVIWARKKLTKVPLEDINWARELLNDADKRLAADAASLNLDTPEGLLEQLVGRRDGDGQGGAGCRPLDVEKALADYASAVEVPDPEEIRRAIVVPEIPREFPAVRQLLEQLAREPLDPWHLELGPPGT